MSTAIEEQQEFSRLLTILVRRKWWFILPIFWVSALGVIIALVLPDIFLSRSTILIENQAIPQSFVSSPVTSYAEQRIQTITQEVMSRSRILGLIRNYDLFPKKRKYLTTDTLIEKIRNRISIEPINAEIHHQAQNRPFLLTIAFSLSFQDEDPRKAQAVANEISSYYLEKNLESREKHVQSTTKFLDEQLREAKAELSDLQAQIARFQQEHLEELPEFMTLNMQKIEKLNDELRRINMQIHSLENQKVPLKSRITLLKSQGSEKIISSEERLSQLELERAQLLAQYSENHPLVRAKNREIDILKERNRTAAPGAGKDGDRLTELERKLIELKSAYSPQHPAVKELEKEIETLHQNTGESRNNNEPSDTEDDFAAAAANPGSISLQAELERIDATIGSLKAERIEIEKTIRDIEGKMRSMPSVAKRFNELDRDYQAARASYREITEKLSAAKISQGMEEEQLGEKFTVVEPAFLPDKPYKPNRTVIIALGFLIGCGLSLFLVTFREYTDENIRDSAALEDVTGIPVLATIAAMKSPADIAHERQRKVMAAVMVFCSLALAAYLAHHYLIDFYIVYSRLAYFLRSNFIF
ncbi:MAG: GNVR domain-containing protein [bacterium]